MKSFQLISLLVMTIILGSLLAGCVGGGATATINNWPGLTIDQASGMAYLSHAQNVQAINLNEFRDVRDEKTGQVVSQTPTFTWNFPVEANKAMSFSAPVAIADDGQLIIGGQNKILYSLDPKNGTQNWQNQDAGNRYYAEALTLDTRIYAPNIDHSLYAVSTNGELLWTFMTENALWSKPISDGKLVYLAGLDHVLYAIDPETGFVRWQSEDLGGAIVASPRLGSNGELYVGTLGSELIALDTTANGNILWRLRTTGWIYSTPALSNGRLYFGDLSGTFYVVDATNGKTIWQTILDPEASKDREIVTTPLVLGDSVYFGNKAGHVFAYDAIKDSPDLQWDIRLTGKLYAPVHVFGDTIIFTLTGTGPILVGLDQTGKQVWSYSTPK